MSPNTKILLSLVFPVLLAACDRVPDCDGRQAEELMATIVYNITSYALCDNDGLLINTVDPPIPKEPFPAAIEMSPRQAAITNMYFPRRMIALDREWLRPRIAAQIPERYRNVSCRVSLMIHDFAAIRRAIGVRLADHERLPDRIEDGRTYTKVCRAKLMIEPTEQPEKTTEAITLTYSVNSRPRGSRFRATKPGPFYTPINFFEATEPPLPFSLSDGEKAALMAMGAVRDSQQARPEPQSPVLRIERRALRALREYFEHREALPSATPNSSIDRTPPAQLDAMPHATR